MIWLGVVLIMLGNVRLARQVIDAFWLILAGNFFWTVAGILDARYDVVALGLTSIIIHTRNLILWKRHNDRRNRLPHR